MAHDRLITIDDALSTPSLTPQTPLEGEVLTIVAGLPVFAGGGAVGLVRAILTVGDGVTLSWVLSTPWAAGTLLFVYVDGLLTETDSEDRVAGSFQMDRPPALSARMTAVYNPA